MCELVAQGGEKSRAPLKPRLSRSPTTVPTPRAGTWRGITGPHHPLPSSLGKSARGEIPDVSRRGTKRAVGVGERGKSFLSVQFSQCALLVGTMERFRCQKGQPHFPTPSVDWNLLFSPKTNLTALLRFAVPLFAQMPQRDEARPW